MDKRSSESKFQFRQGFSLLITTTAINEKMGRCCSPRESFVSCRGNDEGEYIGPNFKLLLCYFVCSRGQDRHPGAVKEFDYFFHDWEDLQCRSNGAP